MKVPAMIINVCDMIDDVVIMKFFVFCSTLDGLGISFGMLLLTRPMLKVDEIDEWFFLYNRQLDTKVLLLLRPPLLYSKLKKNLSLFY